MQYAESAWFLETTISKQESSCYFFLANAAEIYQEDYCLEIVTTVKKVITQPLFKP